MEREERGRTFFGVVGRPTFRLVDKLSGDALRDYIQKLRFDLAHTKNEKAKNRLQRSLDRAEKTTGTG